MGKRRGREGSKNDGGRQSNWLLNFWMFWLLLIPLVGFGILLSLPNNDNYKIGKNVSLIISIVVWLVSIYFWFLFDSSFDGFQFLYKLPWFDNKIISFGIDGISINYILLTTLLFPICILASWDYIKFLRKEFYSSLIILEFLLIGVFTILDLFGFYIFFEAVLIPMYLIIGIWGAREIKITAAYYFFFYTLVGSLLMLIAIIYIFNFIGTTDYLTILSLDFTLNPTIQNWLFLAFFASLAVKIPKFPFHLWLPLAHVEAPLAGSILLAGILIKLGSYGFIRYTLPIFPDASVYFSPMVYTLGVLAIIYASLTTIRQTDLKRIIAYSSVSHMGLVMLAIFTLTPIGIEGSIFLQIAHGIVSSALFITVTILYDRHHTRIVKYYRGVAMTMPIFALLFLIFTFGNIAVPLTCNFIGEFLSLLALFNKNSFICVLASLGMVLSASYALFLYNRVCFGPFSYYLKHSRDINRREWHVLAPLAFLTILLGVYPNIVLSSTHFSVEFLTTFLN